jgi:hypothetical protein
MEFVRIMGALRKKDTRTIPEIDRELAQSLRPLAEDPDWTLVQSDKKGQWISIRVLDYIADMEIHLQRYCNEILCSQLDRIYKNPTARVDDIEYLFSESKTSFLRSWI